MSKVLLDKFILLLTFWLIGIQFNFAQDKFNLNAQLLVDKKLINDADVIVFKGNSIIAETKTNKTGKFNVALPFQEVFVIQFKKEGLPVLKVLISTKVKDLEADLTKTKVVVFTLLSHNFSTEGSDAKDISAAFQINKNGLLVEDKLKFSEAVNNSEKEQVTTDNEIETLKDQVNKTITELPDSNRIPLKSKFDFLNAKMDSLLFLSKKHAALIIQTAKLKSEEIIADAFYSLPEAIDLQKETSLSTSKNIDKGLKNLSVKEEPFNSRSDIKAYKLKLDKIEGKSNMSKKDSVEYLETVVLFKDEIVKSAKMQLEIDKLNAKTKEDSVELQVREAQIFLVEKDIQEAKNKIEIQQLEIRQKTTMLIFSISALIFFIVLSLLVYNSFRLKKKTNLILEKQNWEIANKNKKIIDSIRYAQTIQQAILPIKATIDKYFDWFLIFQPKDIVSGDFYWFNHFEETGKSVFAVVDCTGHGVPGAFMSMIGNRLLIEAVKEKGIIKPIDILEEIDERIRIALMQDETSNNDGMDMCICTLEYIDDNKCKVGFAGAKRPMFYSDIKNRKMEHIKGTVRGIGGKKRIREKSKKLFEEHNIIINRGEMIYLTSDGFFDLQSPNRKKFGRLNFMSLLEEQIDKPMQKQREAIMDALHLHKGSEFQIDDITILGIKV